MMNKVLPFILILLVIFLVNKENSNKMENSSDKINYILNQVYENYVDSIDMESLIESSIQQTLTNLDPHSVYMNKDEVNSSMVMMQGSFEGIGVEFSIHRDTIVIVNVIPEGPSEKEGLIAGERIVSIEDESVAGIGITNQEVIKRLRGEGGTKVKIGVKNKRDTMIRVVNIIRGKIPLRSLDVAYEIFPGIGYIKLNRFASTTFKEFKTELESLVEEHTIESLILDLRGNTGGYLDQAIKILNEFFENDKLLVYTYGKSRKEQKYFSNSFGLFKNGKLSILIDEGSASASEIIAGAIQDHDRGFIVGERSFGKGLVQEQIPLSDGSLIRLTVSRYYTPLGRCIQKPYDDRNEEYFSEVYNRVNVPNIDTLEKFTTKSGKTVYAGGGIMPDYQVISNHDSLPTSLVYLYTSDFFDDLAFDYVDVNRNIPKDFSNFQITEKQKNDILSSIKDWIILEIGDADNNTKLIEEIEKNKIQLINRFSALIIRQRWGWAEMQMFLNENDEVISTSLSLLKN